MAVGVTNYERLLESKPRCRIRDDAGRNKRDMFRLRLSCGCTDVGCPQDRLPVYEIVGVFICRKRTPVVRCEVFEKLDPGAFRGPQRSDAQTCAEDVIQVFLLRTVI